MTGMDTNIKVFRNKAMTARAGLGSPHELKDEQAVIAKIKQFNRRS